MDKKVLLPTLDILTVNFIFCDVFTLMHSEDLKNLLNGSIDGMQITQEFLLGFAFMMEIPMLMILLSRLYNQPLPDRNADFKFREAKNLGIFTTRQWLDLDKSILRVVHDIDGAWQFLTGDQMPEDIRLVTLEQMVHRDKTLNEVFNLDYGYSMGRDFIGGEWTETK